MRYIKVAYILTPITFGGAEKVSLNFLGTVDRSRFDIRPILLTRPWEEETYFARMLSRLGYTYATVPVAVKPGGNDPLRVPRVAYGLLSLLKTMSFELVHTQGYFADICALPVARILGIPTVSTCHGFISNDRKLKVYNKLDTYALRLCNSVIAVSENIRSELIRQGINNTRISVVPNAVASCLVEDELFADRHGKRTYLNISLEDFVVGYVGRLSEEKGLNYLIEAIADLFNAGVPLKLLIVGEGPERPVLEKIVKDRGLEAIIFFVGFQADVENWLPAFDVFVLPSLTEGTPMALLEAMAMAIPVIATAVGGVPEIVTDGVNGLLVPPGNSSAIRERIAVINNDHEFKCRVGASARDTLNMKYSIHKWVRTMENQYCSIVIN